MSRTGGARVDSEAEAIPKMRGIARQTLCGERFTAADLIFAALAAPALFPVQYRGVPAFDVMSTAMREEVSRLGKPTPGSLRYDYFRRCVPWCHRSIDRLRLKRRPLRPLADGFGDSHVGRAHLDPGATIKAPSLTHAAAILIAHGRVTIETEESRIQFSGGTGCMLAKNEHYMMHSDAGATLLIVEAGELVSSSSTAAGSPRPTHCRADVAG